MSQQNKKYYSLQEVAEIIDISEGTIRRAIKNGLIAYYRIPPRGQFRFTDKHIEDYLMSSVVIPQEDEDALSDYIDGIIE